MKYFTYVPKPVDLSVPHTGDHHDELKQLQFWYERHLNDAHHAMEERELWGRARIKHLFLVLPSGELKWYRK